MGGIFKALRSPSVAGFVVSSFVVLAVLGVRNLGYLESWELKAYDWLLHLQPISQRPPAPIVLIAVTEDDIDIMKSWPLTDAVLAESLQKLLLLKPRTIGVDIYRNFSVAPGEEQLNAVLTRNREVVMVMKFGETALRSVAPPAVLNDTEQIGFNDLLVDHDGVVRRGLLFQDDGVNMFYSFSWRLALQYLQAAGIIAQPDPARPEHVRLGDVTLTPLDSNDGGYVNTDARGYQILLDFQGLRTPIPTYSLTALLGNQIPEEAIQEKIVLIGVTAVSIPDLFHTPYSSGSGVEQRDTFGVLIHAYTADQLLRAGLQGVVPIRSLSESQEALWIAMWGLVGGSIALLGHSLWRFTLITIGGLIVLMIVVYAAFTKGFWIPAVPSALTWLASTALITAYLSNLEKRERAVLMQLFSRHVSPEVAETIWRQRDQFWDGGRPRSQQLVVTVLFTDLEGFTPVAEKLDPQGLMDWMNEYVETMAQLVMKHGGVVDDYYGDAIKANFGVPLPRMSEAEIKQDAMNAVSCALAMEAEMRNLHAVWREQGMPTVRLRIGIYTGLTVAGSLGSAQRLKYTTVGDTVNLAARLESYDKEAADIFAESPCRILVGEPTARYLRDHYRMRKVAAVSLKGKTEQITVYQVLDCVTAQTPKVTEEACK
jgi:adenylate cyclase